MYEKKRKEWYEEAADNIKRYSADPVKAAADDMTGLWMRASGSEEALKKAHKQVKDSNK